jgi:hypothetical protein
VISFLPRGKQLKGSLRAALFFLPERSVRRYWPVTVLDVVVLAVAMGIVGGLYWLATHHAGRCPPSANCTIAKAPD